MTSTDDVAVGGPPRPRVASHPSATTQGRDPTAAARMAAAAAVGARPSGNIAPAAAAVRGDSRPPPLHKAAGSRRPQLAAGGIGL